MPTYKTLSTRLGPLLPRGELITVLKELFPLSIPDPSKTEREIWMKAGEQLFIQKLEQAYKQFMEKLD